MAAHGLTLTGASRVVLLDPAWNPAVDAQAADRCFRIGQTRDVVVYRLVTCGTAEERQYGAQVFKAGLAGAVLGADGGAGEGGPGGAGGDDMDGDGSEDEGDSPGIASGSETRSSGGSSGALAGLGQPLRLLSREDLRKVFELSATDRSETAARIQRTVPEVEAPTEVLVKHVSRVQGAVERGRRAVTGAETHGSEGGTSMAARAAAASPGLSWVGQRWSGCIVDVTAHDDVLRASDTSEAAGDGGDTGVAATPERHWGRGSSGGGARSRRKKGRGTARKRGAKTPVFVDIEAEEAGEEREEEEEADYGESTGSEAGALHDGDYAPEGSGTADPGAGIGSEGRAGVGGGRRRQLPDRAARRAARGVLGRAVAGSSEEEGEREEREWGVGVGTVGDSGRGARRGPRAAGAAMPVVLHGSDSDDSSSGGGDDRGRGRGGAGAGATVVGRVIELSDSESESESDSGSSGLDQSDVSPPYMEVGDAVPLVHSGGGGDGDSVGSRGGDDGAPMPAALVISRKMDDLLHLIEEAAASTGAGEEGGQHGATIREAAVSLGLCLQEHAAVVVRGGRGDGEKAGLRSTVAEGLHRCMEGIGGLVGRCVGASYCGGLQEAARVLLGCAAGLAKREEEEEEQEEGSCGQVHGTVLRGSTAEGGAGSEGKKRVVAWGGDGPGEDKPSGGAAAAMPDGL